MPLGLKPSVGGEKRLLLLSSIFFAAVAIALFFPALFSQKLIYGYDVFYLGLPFHAEVQRCLAAHEWPLWMPDLLGGMPGIASCNLLFMYPTDFIGCLNGTGFPLLVGLDASIHVALAGIGMFLFLRRLDRGFSASLLGALFFAVSGSLISQLYGGFYNFVEGIAMVPWVFWAAHKAQQERSWFAWGICGLAFALQILAGGAQVFVYTLTAAALFILALAWKSGPGAVDTGKGQAKGRPAACLAVLAGLGAALGLAFLLAAPQLWPTLQYLPLSARQGFSYATFISGSIRPSEALTWLVPGFFGWQEPTYHGAVRDCFTNEYFGLLPWALATGALFALWRSEAKVRWLAAMVPAAFFFAQNRWTPFYTVFQHLPVISGFRIWSRTLFLLTFAVCALAAYGWDALRDARTRMAALRGAGVFLAVAAAAAAFAWALAPSSAAAAALSMPWLSAPPGSPGSGGAQILSGLARDSARTTLELIPALLALLWFATLRLNAGAALVLALALHGLDQSSLTSRFIHFMDPAAVAAEAKTEFTLPPPAAPGLEPWRIFDPDGARPHNDMLLAYDNLFGEESMPSLGFVRTLEAMNTTPAGHQDWLSLMNVRYVFSHSRQWPHLSGDQVTVHENQGAFPRAWLVGRSRKLSGDNEAYRLLADPGFHPRSEVALGVDAGLSGGPPQGAVTWLERSPEAFSLAVSTNTKAALVVSDFWYPSWRASVDGEDTPVLKADGGLQAVILGAGSHRVDFRFDPGLFYDALAACLAGLVALVGLLWYDAQAHAFKAG